MAWLLLRSRIVICEICFNVPSRPVPTPPIFFLMKDGFQNFKMLWISDTTKIYSDHCTKGKNCRSFGLFSCGGQIYKKISCDAKRPLCVIKQDLSPWHLSSVNCKCHMQCSFSEFFCSPKLFLKFSFLPGFSFPGRWIKCRSQHRKRFVRDSGTSRDMLMIEHWIFVACVTNSYQSCIAHNWT